MNNQNQKCTGQGLSNGESLGVKFMVLVYKSFSLQACIKMGFKTETCFDVQIFFLCVDALRKR